MYNRMIIAAESILIVGGKKGRKKNGRNDGPQSSRNIIRISYTYARKKKDTR